LNEYSSDIKGVYLGLKIDENRYDFVKLNTSDQLAYRKTLMIDSRMNSSGI
jgi:hypothetical protein